jgi:hypothetical protein
MGKSTVKIENLRIFSIVNGEDRGKNQEGRTMGIPNSEQHRENSLEKRTALRNLWSYSKGPTICVLEVPEEMRKKAGLTKHSMKQWPLPLQIWQKS